VVYENGREIPKPHFPALRCKTWLFYTLIESCRRRRVDSWKYLVWIFEELPKIKVTAGTFSCYIPKAYAKSLSKPRLKKTV